MADYGINKMEEAYDRFCFVSGMEAGTREAAVSFISFVGLSLMNPNNVTKGHFTVSAAAARRADLIRGPHAEIIYKAYLAKQWWFTRLWKQIETAPITLLFLCFQAYDTWVMWWRVR